MPWPTLPKVAERMAGVETGVGVEGVMGPRPKPQLKTGSRPAGIENDLVITTVINLHVLWGTW